MNNERFLIIGGKGLIGSQVAKEVSDCKLTYLKRAFVGGIQCDVTNFKNVADVFSQVKPTHVVHTGNFPGGAKACETNKTQARKFYVEGTKHLIDQCAKHKARLIFLSTECVFDGKKEEVDETDSVAPINHYGEFKADAEVEITNTFENYIIVRTMWVFGWQPETITPNALMSAYFAIKENKTLPVATYRFGTPTYATHLAKAIVDLSHSRKSGIYHVAGPTFINRYEWLLKSCKTLNWDSQFLVKQDYTVSGEVSFPSRIRFNTQKFEKDFKSPFKNLDETLLELKEDVYENQHK